MCNRYMSCPALDALEMAMPWDMAIITGHIPSQLELCGAHMDLPNLKVLFGDKYRIAFDKAAEGTNDPSMMELRCRGGGVTIYPHGPATLAVECIRRPGIAKRLAALGLKLHQDGEREKTYLCPLHQFDEVAAIVHPLRRPTLTADQRAAMSARMVLRNAEKIAKSCLKFASKAAQPT